MTTISNRPRAAHARKRPTPATTARLRGLAVALSIAGLGLGVAPATSAAPATTSAFGHQGHAFGSYVSVAGKANSGPSAVSVLGCGPPPGFSNHNASAAAAFGTTMSSATLATTAHTSASPDQAMTTASAHDVSLLGGRVTATAVKSVSITSHDASGYHTSAAGSTFTDLVVLGTPVVASPPANTTIALPGIGHVVLNEQRPVITTSGAKLDVWALHAVVDQANASGFAVGTSAIVAGAYSAMTPSVGGFLNGFAYGSQAHAGTLAHSDPSFLEILPCNGTKGRLQTNSGSTAAVPGVINSGKITDTARGSTTATSATGETTSTVSSTNLVNGLVKATNVKADAHVTRTNGMITVSGVGSTFGSIVVKGRTLNIHDVPANTAIHLNGVGTLFLHRTIVTARSIEIRMIELVVTAPNVHGLPVGTDIRAAVAGVGAHI